MTQCLSISPSAVSEVTRLDHEGWIYSVHVAHHCFRWDPMMWRPLDALTKASLYSSHLFLSFCFFIHISAFSFVFLEHRLLFNSLFSDSGMLILQVDLQVKPGQQLAFASTPILCSHKFVYLGLFCFLIIFDVLQNTVLSTLLPFNKVLTSSKLLFNWYFLFRSC